MYVFKFKSVLFAFAMVLMSIVPVAAGTLQQKSRVPEANSPNCKVQFVSEKLTSNRHHGMANSTLQVTVWYDGQTGGNTPMLYIEYVDPSTSSKGWITVGTGNPGDAIDKFSTQIETREYFMDGCEPTGLVKISGVSPDGVIDGMAVGLFAKNNSGQYRLFKSDTLNWTSPLAYVGMWPAGFSNATFNLRTPQLNGNGFGREQARGMIIGAEYLPNGAHTLQ